MDISSIEEERRGLAFVPRLSERELARNEEWGRRMIDGRGGMLLSSREYGVGADRRGKQRRKTYRKHRTPKTRASSYEISYSIDSRVRTTEHAHGGDLWAWCPPMVGGG